MSLDVLSILDSVKNLVDAVTSVENTYTRKIAPVNQEDFIDKFRTSAKDLFLGFQIYRASRTTEIISFKNVLRHAHTIVTRGVISAGENPTITYNTLQSILNKIQNKLMINLTLGETMEDAEMPSLGEITMDTTVGRGLWTGDVMWVVYEREIIASIS